jgi:hypothetical protein
MSFQPMVAYRTFGSHHRLEGGMSARRFCYFAALILAGPAPAAALGYPGDANELDLRARLFRAQSIMEKLDRAPAAAADKAPDARVKLSFLNFLGVHPLGHSPWNNAWANAAVPWGNGWANAPVRVNPWNNWTNWSNAAARNWNNAPTWLNAAPRNIPGEACSPGLGCSVPPGSLPAQQPTFQEGQTYFPHGPTFETPQGE